MKKVIKKTENYTEKEVEHHVKNGLDSKVSDLVDTIDVHKIINQ